MPPVAGAATGAVASWMAVGRTPADLGVLTTIFPFNSQFSMAPSTKSRGKPSADHRKNVTKLAASPNPSSAVSPRDLVRCARSFPLGRGSGLMPRRSRVGYRRTPCGSALGHQLRGKVDCLSNFTHAFIEGGAVRVASWQLGTRPRRHLPRPFRSRKRWRGPHQTPAAID